MNVLVIGSGGREHALCWKLAQSPNCSKLYVAPGNAGTSEIAKNLSISPMDFEGIKKIILDNKIKIVVVGPEVPLVSGITDFLKSDKELDTSVIGPTKYAAQLEGSKFFAKEFMKRNNIPTAKFCEFTSKTILEGYDFLERIDPPYVLKADGLAAGKGVLIIDNIAQAKEELKQMLLNEKFGEASKRVIIEEHLEGIELSCFVLTDGKYGLVLPMAKDYKRIGEGDKGLNTGGMGAISPVPFVDSKLMNKIKTKIISPTLNGIKKEKIYYKGFIFIGLIIAKGEPKVIEYNVRMGDPETQVVIPRIKNDLLDIFIAVSEQKLNKIKLEIESRSASSIIAVSQGYPEQYQKGYQISGIENVNNALIFHSGTTKKNNKTLTSGGRVLAITGFGNNFVDALRVSYKEIQKIQFNGMNYRKDIGFDL
ncbi:MAG: phosphoribosylamine--glycine ligase [Flavobacteriaceae bacterium]|nr:phosphoribosylamine--glycine ligase [Flavobacteriaceae bacterium]|tara:strand:- start:20666 stop:21934 length:1269 start_codon:yes stop_codon:yes gene_type:complete